MDLPATVLGIDIAKLKFDVCLIKPNGKAKHKVFPNTRDGFEQLARWFASHQVANSRACLEATGTYGEALALFLFEAGFVVMRRSSFSAHKTLSAPYFIFQL